jgi:hypothetical protein
MKTKLAYLFTLLFIAILATACSSSANSAAQGETISALSQAEATAMIDSAMQGFNTGDYAVWSRDWDAAMKAAIKDADFQSYRSQVVARYGSYLSLESVEMLPGLNEGFVRWSAVVNFEKGKMKFTFGYMNDGREIKGVFPEEVN